MIFNKFYYNDMKDFFHPIVRRYIEHHPDPDDDCIYLRLPIIRATLKLEGVGERISCTEMGIFAVLEDSFIQEK